MVRAVARSAVAALFAAASADRDRPVTCADASSFPWRETVTVRTELVSEANPVTVIRPLELVALPPLFADKLYFGEPVLAS